MGTSSELDAAAMEMGAERAREMGGGGGDDGRNEAPRRAERRRSSSSSKEGSSGAAGKERSRGERDWRATGGVTTRTSQMGKN
jgi:hypothetical protein